MHALLGLQRFPTDDTIRNLFRKFGMGQVQRLFEPLAEWQMQRLPQRSEGYTLDLDSTVFERYGKQEGSLQGHNPRKHGRPSHPPLLAVLSEAHFREDRDSVGRKRIDVPGYSFRVLVTSCADPPEQIWRDYNQRAGMESRSAFSNRSMVARQPIEGFPRRAVCRRSSKDPDGKGHR